MGTKAVLSNQEGKYEVSALDPGVYSVAVEAPFPGYEAKLQQTEVLGGETKTVDVYLDFKKTTVGGYVYDSDGKPISGAVLSGVLSGSDMDSTWTNEQGYFRFERVSPGDRFIRVNAKGFMGQTLDFTANEGQTNNLEFKLSAASCAIRGNVFDSDGKPLRAEVMMLAKGIVNQKTFSNPSTGQFEFYILPGFYEVIVTAPGYEPKAWTGNVSTDQKVDFTLKILPPAEPPQ